MRYDLEMMAVIVGAFAMVMLTTTLVFWFMFRSHQKHLLDVLDRFLSRHFEEYNLTKMVSSEIEIDQGSDSEEADEDKAFDDFLSKLNTREEAAKMVGGS